MRPRHIIIFLFILLFAGCTSSTQTNESICDMLTRYPQAQMQDIYKTFYQDRFGAGHMINDTSAVREYLLWEVTAAEADTVVNPYYELTGSEGRFVRVYLRCVNEGLLSAEQLFDAFVRSAQPTKQPQQTWEDEWKQIEQAALKVHVVCSDEDREQLLYAAHINAAVHHSDPYREAYHPHYRIVERSIFDDEIRHLIER